MPVGTRTTTYTDPTLSIGPATPLNSMAAGGGVTMPKPLSPNSTENTPLQTLLSEEKRLKHEVNMLTRKINRADPRVKLTGSAPSQRQSPAINTARLLELDEEEDAMPSEYKDNFSTPALMLTALKEAVKPEEKTGSYIATETAKLLASDLSKAKRCDFIKTMWNHGALADSRVEKLMDLATRHSDKDLDAMIEQRGLDGVNKRMAATIYACLKHEGAPTVELLLKATVDEPKLGVSGVRIIEWIVNVGTLGSYGQHEKEKDRFDEKSFFKAGLTSEYNEVNGANLLSEINALPASYRAHKYATLELILKKIPFHLKDCTWVNTLRTDFHIKTRGGAGGEAPWEPKELISLISSFLELEPFDPGPVVRAATHNNSKGGGGEPADARAKKLRGEEVTGTAGTWQTKGYSFIKLDGGHGDVFCHTSALKVGDQLAKGARVRLKVVFNTRRGKDEASDVSLIDQAVPDDSATDQAVPAPPATANIAYTQTEEEEEEQQYRPVIYVNR